MKKSLKLNGFTLIEVLTAIVVISLLSAGAVKAYKSLVDPAQSSSALSNQTTVHNNQTQANLLYPGAVNLGHLVGINEEVLPPIPVGWSSNTPTMTVPKNPPIFEWKASNGFGGTGCTVPPGTITINGSSREEIKKGLDAYADQSNKTYTDPNCLKYASDGFGTYSSVKFSIDDFGFYNPTPWSSSWSYGLSIILKKTYSFDGVNYQTIGYNMSFGGGSEIKPAACPTTAQYTSADWDPNCHFSGCPSGYSWDNTKNGCYLSKPAVSAKGQLPIAVDYSGVCVQRGLKLATWMDESQTEPTQSLQSPVKKVATSPLNDLTNCPDSMFP